MHENLFMGLQPGYGFNLPAQLQRPAKFVEIYMQPKELSWFPESEQKCTDQAAGWSVPFVVYI